MSRAQAGPPMVSFNFEFSKSSTTTNQQQQQQQTAISTPTSPPSLPQILSLDTALPSPSHSPPRSPATPPPTPLSASLLSHPALESSQLMLELTRAKLERAAQGQLTGRRAAGLRELVLLSNAFVGALTPDWARREQDRQLAEQRKLDEERWLDGILEEMSVEDEEDEDEAYVEISYVDEREPHDSGYLDQHDGSANGEGPKASTSSLEPIQETSNIFNSFDSIEDDYHHPRDETEADPVVELTAGSDSIVDAPGPSKSPPIPVPTSPTRSSAMEHHIDDCCASESPPSDPPPLTPDCSPRDQSSELLGSSLDSFELPDRFGLDRLDWLQHSGHKRQGLFSVQSASAAGADRASLPRLELNTTSPDSLALETFSRTGIQAEDQGHADCLLHSSLVPRSATASPSPQWVSPSPSRSLSLPPLSRAKADSPTATPHPIPSFQSGIVTLWDCVDFGKHAPPIPYFAPGGQDRQRSLPSSPERGRGKIEQARAKATVGGGQGQAERERGMAVRALPEFPPLVVAGEEDRMGRSPWRARSMSPEVGGRRGWTSLGQLE